MRKEINNTAGNKTEGLGKRSLLERLGKPLDQLEYSVFEKLRIICSALQKAWEIPTDGDEFFSGSVEWFREFLKEAWEELGHPCSRRVMELAFSYLRSREEAGRKMLRVAESWAKGEAAGEPEYMDSLSRFLAKEYGFNVKKLLPAKRGFYGETWNVQAESGTYFLKLDYWEHHKESLQNMPLRSLPMGCMAG